MFNIYYIYKGMQYCDTCICDNEKDALDGFDMAHANDDVLLLNVEKVSDDDEIMA